MPSVRSDLKAEGGCGSSYLGGSLAHDRCSLAQRRSRWEYRLDRGHAYVVFVCDLIYHRRSDGRSGSGDLSAELGGGGTIGLLLGELGCVTRIMVALRINRGDDGHAYLVIEVGLDRGAEVDVELLLWILGLDVLYGESQLLDAQRLPACDVHE